MQIRTISLARPNTPNTAASKTSTEFRPNMAKKDSLMLLDSPLRTLQKERHPVVKILTGKKPNMFSVETDLRSRKIHHIMKVFRGEHKRGEVSKLPKEETLRFKNPLQEKLTILRQSKKSLKRLLECLTTKLWCLRTNSIRMRIQQLPQKLPFKNPQMMKRL